MAVGVAAIRVAVVAVVPSLFISVASTFVSATSGDPVIYSRGRPHRSDPNSWRYNSALRAGSVTPESSEGVPAASTMASKMPAKTFFEDFCLARMVSLENVIHA